MKLFTKDRFSEYHVHLTRINDEEEVSNLINILKQFQVRYQGVNSVSIYAFGELGINSSNYLISTSMDQFVLKKSSNLSELQLDFYCNFSNKLKCELGVFPSFHKSRSNKFFHYESNSFFCLLDYIEGQYFEGTKAQLQEVAKVINSINEYCSSISQPNFFPSRRFDLVHINKIIKSIPQSRSSRKFLNPRQDSIISENIVDFYRACDYLSETNNFHFGNEQLVHIDLHPHNILFKNNMLTGVLDIDSFKFAQPCIAYGFAAYKLYRQSIVHNNGIEEEYSISKFIDQMHINCNAELLLKGALIEVLTRACIILEPLLDGRMSPWINVLEIQLIGISEVLYFLDGIDE